MEGKTGALTGCVVLGIIGIIMLIAFVMLRVNAWKKKIFYTMRIEAVVSDIEKNQHADENQSLYSSVLSYTIGKTQYKKKVDLSRMHLFCKKGDKVVLLCDPKHPDRFYPEKSNEKLLSVLTLIFAAFALAGSVLMAFSAFNQ